MPSIDLIKPAAAGAGTVSTILHTLALPALGAHWLEEGGIFAGVVRGEYGMPDVALIVSALDAGGEFESEQWGEYGKDVPGARGRDGKASTRAMADAGSAVAQKVLAIAIAGKSDWHIGSQAEMHVAAANVPEVFSQRDYYWTSTQGSRSSAFVQDFELGSSSWYVKDFDSRVRAVRTIQLQPLTA